MHSAARSQYAIPTTAPLARPTYPKQLYDFLFAYHGRDPRARWDTALDLGCGTGQATLELTPFKHVVGTDPSQGMLAQAREALHARPEINIPGRFKFVQSGAEELGWLEDKSVDMVVSGAYHRGAHQAGRTDTRCSTGRALVRLGEALAGGCPGAQARR